MDVLDDILELIRAEVADNPNALAQIDNFEAIVREAKGGRNNYIARNVGMSVRMRRAIVFYQQGKREKEVRRLAGIGKNTYYQMRKILRNRHGRSDGSISASAT